MFNIMKCIDEGHELVAIANLYPPTGNEMDSYMYQTVGAEMIEQIALCLSVPLYRRPITGTPLDQTMEYTANSQDEVEDLFLLISEIVSKHPDIKGVSSGAIMSTYQKNRVVNICERLGLASLAYLWERDQKQLLQEMIDRGMHVVLIKVASYGLHKCHLGQTIAQLKDYLFELSDNYGVHPCGEGGEFESLTLDCPIYKQRIQM